MSDSVQPARVHAFRDDALGDRDATATAAAIRDGEISATEAVEAAIHRAEGVDGTLNAIEFLDAERALKRAGRVDAGLRSTPFERADAELRGVPSAFKDNVLVAGLPMTQGSRALPRTINSMDAKVVKQILGTGLIPFATTTMPPFGWTATTERPGGNVTRNPWNPEYSSGGSSGGAAALVAAGVIPIAHGNDGGGSIRIPAAACGLVGLKPTRGRLILGENSAQMPVRIVTDSVLTRTVRDVVTFYNDAERVHHNRRLRPLSAGEEAPRELTVGLMLDSPFAPPTDDETRQTVLDAASLLESLGHHVEPYEPVIPDFFQQDFLDYWAFLAFTTVTGGKRLFHKGFDASKLDPFTLGLAETGRRRLAHAPKFIARLRASSLAYRQQLNNGPDVVLSPTLGHTTPKIGWLAGDLDYETHLERLLAYCCFTPLHNATGAPAISLPLGETASGLPIGVMVSANHGQEGLLLDLGLQMEQARPFRRIDA